MGTTVNVLRALRRHRARKHDEALTVAERPKPAFEATPKQQEFLERVVLAAAGYSENIFLAIGGGIRGTKTFALLAALIILCRMYPGSRWAIVRKDLPSIKRNLLPSFNKIRDMTGGFLGPVNQSTWTATCRNGSAIILFTESLKDDPDLDRWKGFEVNGFALDEANEISELAANKAKERAGSYVIPPTKHDPNPKQPAPVVLFSFNPAGNWVRTWFFVPWSTGTMKAPYHFTPATIKDNPFASEAYKKSLTYLPPREYARFVLGEWENADDPNQLILAEWILNAARNVLPVYGVRRLGADVAREGDDNTAFVEMDGNAVTSAEEWHGWRTTKTALELHRRILLSRLPKRGGRVAPLDAKNVRVDAIGPGGGVVDTLLDTYGHDVYSFKAGASAVPRRDPEGDTETVVTFKNIRSQAAWELREKFRLGTICLDFPRDESGAAIIPPRLMADLTAMHYEIRGDREVLVEEKKKVKDTLKRSPDLWDALVMAAFDIPVVRGLIRIGSTSGRSLR